METSVVTATYGASDTPFAPVEQDVPARWVCYTDNPGLEVPEPWEKVVEKPRFKHPCLSAKVFKMLGPKRWIWIDANIEITSSTFAREAFESVNDGIAIYRHPRRDCIYDEAVASLTSEGQDGKYELLPLVDQAASYRAEGHPEHGGLYACGVIVWDGATPRLGTSWLAECVRWGYQDQVSLPVVCRRLGIEPGVFPHEQIEHKRRGYLQNRWLKIHPHS